MKWLGFFSVFRCNVTNGECFSAERITRNAETGRGMADHDYEVEKPKAKPWLGYYDFLISEGSYKFWIVFQVSAGSPSNTCVSRTIYPHIFPAIYNWNIDIFRVCCHLLCEIHDNRLPRLRRLLLEAQRPLGASNQNCIPGIAS